MSSAEQVTMVSDSRLIGQVKWFNNKAGYGFITVKDGDYANKDIFAHFSALRVTTSQYKYLMEGEYVEFDLVKSEGGKHEYQATDISGIKGGGLMCETRNTNRQPSLNNNDARPQTSQRRYSVPQENAGRSTERTDQRSSGRRPPAPRQRKNPTPQEQQM
jgi:cold shock CspA family protein